MTKNEIENLVRNMKAEINDFEYDGKILKLKTPVKLEVSKVGAYYYAVNNEIELCGSGKTQDGAIINARELFSELYILSNKIINIVDSGGFNG